MGGPENSGAARPINAPVTAEVEPGDVYRQIGEKVVWSLRNNQEKVRIALDPPELGSIYLEISRDKENIQTTLWADNPLTKATLENSQSQIQKIIENEGFQLEKFSVFMQQERGSFAEERRHPVYERTGDSQRKEPGLELSGVRQGPSPRARSIFGNNTLDVFV